jgi:hypothetical protein
MHSAHTHANSQSDGYRDVRAAFIARGISLNIWCKRYGVTHHWAARVLTGKANGPAAERLKARLRRAAGLTRDP